MFSKKWPESYDKYYNLFLCDYQLRMLKGSSSSVFIIFLLTFAQIIYFSLLSELRISTDRKRIKMDKILYK